MIMVEANYILSYFVLFSFISRTKTKSIKKISFLDYENNTFSFEYGQNILLTNWKMTIQSKYNSLY